MASTGNTGNNNITSSWSAVVQMAAPKLPRKLYVKYEQSIVKPKSFIELNELEVKQVVSKDGFRSSNYIVVPEGKTLRHIFEDIDGPAILVAKPRIVASKKTPLTKMALSCGDSYIRVNPNAHPLDNILENPTWPRIPLYPDPAEMEDMGFQF